MIVSFPFTNPVAFNREGTYHNYADAFGREQTQRDDEGTFIGITDSDPEYWGENDVKVDEPDD